MTMEQLTLLVSLLAIIVSVVSLIRTRKLAEEQLRLDRVTADLSQKQLDRLHAEEAAAKKTEVRITLENDGRSCRFRIKNIGQSKAEEVWVTAGPDAPGSVFIPDEYKQRIPIPFMNAGDEVSFFAAIFLGSITSFTMRLRWINEDGTQSQKECFVSM